MRNRNKLVPVATVRPGSLFRHYGIQYRRATEKEAERHPGRELAARRNRPLVFAFQEVETKAGGTREQPLTFVPDLNVVITTERGGRRG